MYISSDILEEVNEFLKELYVQNLSADCKVKLCILVEKLNIILNKTSQLPSSINEDSENPYEIPTKDYSTDSLKLPTKVNPTNWSPEMTLSGLLYYRYDHQLWDRFPYSYLCYFRLICEKNLPNYQNSNNNDSPFSGKSTEICLFLMGYKAVETGKDCGMNYVFKLTHPTLETKVFATETEEECTEWVKQINQYSTGVAPKENKCFPRQLTQHAEIFDEPDTGQIIHENPGNCLIDESLVNSESSHLRRQSADIMNIISNNVINGKGPAMTDKKFNRSRSSYSFKTQTAGLNLSYPNSTPTNSNSLISSVRRKVESFGHKYRNRKSFAGFTNNQSLMNGNVNNNNNNINNGTVLNNSILNNNINTILSQQLNTSQLQQTIVTQTNNVHKNKSKTMPQITTIEHVINNQSGRRSSSLSINKLFPQHKDAIYSGIAKLRIQGHKSGWIERWCQLKPQLLECYHIRVNTSNNNNNNPNNCSPKNNVRIITSNNNVSTQQIEEPILDFALCLENLNLSVSNDKKHRSALRLSCESIKQDLLFEVLDKVIMGHWIKAFIEALGLNNISKKDTYQEDTKSNNSTNSNVNKQKTNPNTSLLSNEISEIQEPECIDEDALNRKDSDIMQRSLTTIHSESIYDEVCSTDGLGIIGTPIMRMAPLRENDISSPIVPPTPPPPPSNRRWSIPVMHIDSSYLYPPAAPVVGRRSIKDHPLPSLPASSPDSENNSDSLTDDTPTGTLLSEAEVPETLDYSAVIYEKPKAPTRSNTLKETKSSNDEFNISTKSSGDSKMKNSFICEDQQVHSVSTIERGMSTNNPSSNGIMSTSLYTYPPEADDSRQYYFTTDNRHNNNQHNHLNNQFDNGQHGCSLADLIARFDDESSELVTTVSSNKTTSTEDSSGSSAATTTTFQNISQYYNTHQSSSSATSGDKSNSKSASVISMSSSCDNKSSQCYTHQSSTSSSSSNSHHSYQQYQSISTPRSNMVCRSASADTNLASGGMILSQPSYSPVNLKSIHIINTTTTHTTNTTASTSDSNSAQSTQLRNSDQSKLERPNSLLISKHSLEKLFEEITLVKEDIKQLKEKKKELKRNNSSKSDPLKDIINSIESQLSFKESRLKDLSSQSKKRFTIDLATKLKRNSSNLSAE